MPQENGTTYDYVPRPWPKAEVIFRPGEKRPDNHLSVKGQIYDIVEAHPEGIRGEELAQLAQKRIRTPRSHHAQGEPEIEWVRRYISGMTRPTFGYLRTIS